MAQHNTDGRQTHSLAQHLGRGAVTQNMSTMNWSLDAGSVHRAGNNLTNRLVRQTLDGRHGSDKDMPIVDDGPLLQIGQDGVADILWQR